MTTAPPSSTLLNKLASFFTDASQVTPSDSKDAQKNEAAETFLSPPTLPKDLEPVPFPELDESAGPTADGAIGTLSRWKAPFLLSPLPFSPISLSKVEEKIQEQERRGGGSRESIMLYSPIIPRKDSIVSIAQTLGPVLPPPPPPPKDQPNPVSQPENPSQALAPTQYIPSSTELSVQVLWWGYRLYLPPPLLAILSSQQVATTRRTAILTSALIWCIDNIPPEIGTALGATSPGLVKLLSLLKGLIPFVGYIGTAISWGWGVVIGRDEGYGVILTAAWVLPFVLIPQSWPQPDDTTPALDNQDSARIQDANTPTTAVDDAVDEPSDATPTMASAVSSLGLILDPSLDAPASGMSGETTPSSHALEASASVPSSSVDDHSSETYTSSSMSSSRRQGDSEDANALRSLLSRPHDSEQYSTSPHGLSRHSRSRTVDGSIERDADGKSKSTKSSASPSSSSFSFLKRSKTAYRASPLSSSHSVPSPHTPVSAHVTPHSSSRSHAHHAPGISSSSSYPLHDSHDQASRRYDHRSTHSSYHDHERYRDERRDDRYHDDEHCSNGSSRHSRNRSTSDKHSGHREETKSKRPSLLSKLHKLDLRRDKSYDSRSYHHPSGGEMRREGSRRESSDGREYRGYEGERRGTSSNDGSRVSEMDRLKRYGSPSSSFSNLSSTPSSPTTSFIADDHSPTSLAHPSRSRTCDDYASSYYETRGDSSDWARSTNKDRRGGTSSRPSREDITPRERMDRQLEDEAQKEWEAELEKRTMADGSRRR